MPVFAYKALDLQGKESAGTLAADNRAAAVEQVIRQGFTPVLVQERTETAQPVVKTPARAGRVPLAYIE